jgi:hypothetical protein
MDEGTVKDRYEGFRTHTSAAWRAWRDSVRALVPEKFVDKTREARREALLAVRSLIDCAIDEMGPSKTDASPPSKPKIRVDDAPKA